MNQKTSIFGGIDARMFDDRTFEIKRSIVLQLCKDFRLGPIMNHSIGKDISISHSNHVIFVKTRQGRYVFKFNPIHFSKYVTKEFVLNRFLIKNNFRTPFMLATSMNKPFVNSAKYLISCFEYIEGQPLYLKSLGPKLISEIAKTMLSMNTLLDRLTVKKNIRNMIDRETYARKLSDLKNSLKDFKNLKEKNKISKDLRILLSHYRLHTRFFKNKMIHSNISLSNMLQRDGHIYTLDLSHVRFDYELDDLANLNVSLNFFDIPEDKNKALNNEYFKIFVLGSYKVKVLYNFLLLKYYKEYLKILWREKKVNLQKASRPNIELFKLELEKQKNKIQQQIEKFLCLL